MRDFINGIFAFIDSESLTDEEYDALPEGLEQEYTKTTYDALKAVLQARESISGQLAKLKSYFEAKGANLSATAATDPASQIFVGAALC